VGKYWVLITLCAFVWLSRGIQVDFVRNNSPVPLVEMDLRSGVKRKNTEEMDLWPTKKKLYVFFPVDVLGSANPFVDA